MDYDQLQTLSRSARRAPLWPKNDAAATVAIDREGVTRLIPHREPFLLVDAITGVDVASRSARGRRAVDPADPVFTGHFPGRPIYPGVLQLEMVGQLGLCLLQLLAANAAMTPGAPRDARAVRVHAAQFHAPVLPGDALTLLCRIVEQDDFTATCAGQVWRDTTLCSFGIMEVYFVEP